MFKRAEVLKVIRDDSGGEHFLDDVAPPRRKKAAPAMGQTRSISRVPNRPYGLIIKMMTRT